MPSFIFPSRPALAAQKPAVSVQLNRAHPLAYGLEYLYLFHEGAGMPGKVNLVSPAAPMVTNSNVTWVRRSRLSGADFPASSSYLRTGDGAATRVDVAQRSWWVWVMPDSAGAARVIAIATSAFTAGSARDQVAIENPASAGFRFSYNYQWSGGWATWKSPDFGLQAHQCVATYDRGSTANDPIMYVDGWVVTVTETATPSGSPYTGQDAFVFGSNAPGTGGLLDGTIAAVGFWSRLLTAAEVLALYTAPSELLLWTPPRRFFLSVAAAAGHPFYYNWRRRAA